MREKFVEYDYLSQSNDTSVNVCRNKKGLPAEALFQITTYGASKDLVKWLYQLKLGIGNRVIGLKYDDNSIQHSCQHEAWSDDTLYTGHYALLSDQAIRFKRKYNN